MRGNVCTCLWYDGQAEQAADFYVSLIPGSRIESVSRRPDDGSALVVEFTLGGAPFQALNGGPAFHFTEAASVVVMTEDQAETDRLWAALSDGGSESRCGWLQDRYGLSWQIVPRTLVRLLSDPDRKAAERAMNAMFGMKRIDIAALEAAHAG